jgi:hypothetical protein
VDFTQIPEGIPTLGGDMTGQWKATAYASDSTPSFNLDGGCGALR